MSESKLSTDLNHLLAKRSDTPLTLGDIFDRVGDKGFGLLLLVLSLPSALPVPAPGYSTPFGILLIILAFQMMMGRTSPWLPKRALQKAIPEKLARTMLGGAARFFGRVEHLVRPRFMWCSTRAGHFLLGLLVALMSVLMILPIPLTNTAPAMVIFIIGVSLTEDDGAFALAAVAAALAATALYAGVIWLFSLFLERFSWEERDQFKQWLKDWIGNRLS